MAKDRPSIATRSQAYELKEVDLALKDVQQNGGKYSGDAIDSIYRYASAVGAYSGPLPSAGSDDGEEIPIEEVSQ